MIGISNCRDADVFVYAGQEAGPGERLRITGVSSDYRVGPPLYGRWQIPVRVRPIPPVNRTLLGTTGCGRPPRCDHCGRQWSRSTWQSRRTPTSGRSTRSGPAC
ncbi:MAG TPA: hypothetical protein VFX16_18010 [Pseudonocardiaceae bacterium]|nr:hypothetical protein [Pseudonocardiaceae bacterium]